MDVGTLEGLAPVLWPHAPGAMVLAAVVSLGAGVVRGVSGFGYSALVVATLSPVVPIGPIVVAVLMMEVVASAQGIRSAWPLVDPLWHRSVLGANLVFVPIGVAAIAIIDPSVVRVAVASLLLLGAAILRMAIGRHLTPTWWLRTATGIASGLLNGFAASGGLVVALTMSASGVPATRLRPTMVSVLMWISLYGVLCSAALGMTGKRSPFGPVAVGWALLLWPSMLIGIRLGAKAVARMNLAAQSRWVLNLLILVAIASLSASVIVARG